LIWKVSCLMWKVSDVVWKVSYLKWKVSLLKWKWYKMKLQVITYVGTLVSLFTIGPNFAQFGVICYTSYEPAHDGFNLNAFTDANSLFNAINNLPYNSADSGATLSDIAE
jgi:hypothetical protein